MSAISFLAGLGAGYLQESDKQTERARQARLDQITFDRAQRETDAYNEAQSNKAAIRTAAAPLPVETVDGIGPPAEDGSTPRPSYRVGAARFADQGAAAAAAADPEARDGRIAAVLRGSDPEKAQQFEQAGKQGKLTDVQLKQHIQQAQDEGAMRALNAALAGQPADQVEAMYNASGKTKIHNLQITPIEVDHPVLGKQKSMKITGVRDDGTPFELPDALDASFKLFSAEKQFDMIGRKQEKDADRDYRKTTLEETIRHNKASEGLMGEAQALKLQIAGMRVAAGTGGKATTFDKMDEADKEEYRGLKDQIKTITSEITKAQAADNWNEDGANAKRLKSQLASLGMRSRMILDRYGDTDTEAPDPTGARAALKAPAAAPVDAPVPTKGAAKVAAGGVAVPAPALPKPAPKGMAATGDQVSNSIQAANLAALAPLTDAVVQAKQQLAAVARSGDPAALTRYANALQQARDARAAAAAEKLGNSAPQYLSSVEP